MCAKLQIKERHMRSWSAYVAATGVVAFLLVCGHVPYKAKAASAEHTESYTVCIGESEKLCPEQPQHDAWFPCGTTEIDAARSLCKTYYSSRQEVMPFRILKLYDENGNRCGYAGFRILCFGSVMQK